ncbi:Crp/Fnr family transcriptional regulator, partial [Enterococcus hirae]
HTIRFGYKNSVTGPLDTFLSGEPTTYYAEAIKETELLRFTREDIEKVMHKKVDYQLYWTQLLENLVLQQMEREIDLLTSSPKERYER